MNAEAREFVPPQTVPQIYTLYKCLHPKDPTKFPSSDEFSASIPPILHKYKWDPPGPGKSFHKKCLSDTGCSRTVVAKDVADKFGIPILPNTNRDRLQTANKQDLNVNGVIKLRATYKSKTISVNALVTDDLTDEIIVSWHDSHDLGTVTIDGLDNPPHEQSTSAVCNQISSTASRESEDPSVEKPDLSTEDTDLPIKDSEISIREPTGNLAKSELPEISIKEAPENFDNSELPLKNPDTSSKEDPKIGEQTSELPLKNPETSSKEDPEIRDQTPPLTDPEVNKILEKWFDTYTCLSDELSDEPMVGEPMIINLIEGAELITKLCSTGRKVPLHYRTAAEKLVNQLKDKGVIRQTPKSKAPVFCARGFFVPKNNGEDVRLVVDNSEVNKSIKRPVHPFLAGPDQLTIIPPEAKVFCKLDALWGYYQIELAEESRHITTFMTEFGTFEFCRAPMGLNCSGDEFCRRSDDALRGLPGVIKLIDDILIYASNYEELITRVEAVLQRCTEHNITLSRKKIEIGDKVTFAGYDVSAAGHSPTADRIKAITEFPTPLKDKTAVKSFLGMCTGLGSKFVPDFTHAAHELYQLTKKETAWTWGAIHEEAVNKIKSILTSDLILRNFNPDWKTQVVTDASRSGLGFALMQLDPSTKRWHFIQCGSRTTSGAESRYAVCELEGLGIAFAVEKCRHYLLGMKWFEVITDHKSLKGVFKKCLSDVQNARLRRYRERLQEYNFTVDWRPGKFNDVADCLSRYPLSGEPHDSEDNACVCSAVRSPDDPDEGIHFNICGAIRSPEDPDPQLKQLVEAADSDPTYRELKEGINTFYKHEDLPPGHPGHGFKNEWDNFSIHATGLIIVNNDRILVPTAYRKILLVKLHKAHNGTTKTQWRGRRDYWWPKMDEAISHHVRTCGTCIPYHASQPQQPIIPQNISTGPMNVVGTDQFKIGNRDYLVIVDQYSGWPNVTELTGTSSRYIVKAMRKFFNTYGNPGKIHLDNGTNLTSTETFDFLRERKIPIPDPSCPYFPQSNGLAESSVKQVRRLLEKHGCNWQTFEDNLLEWMDTPNDCGSTPGELFLGRRLRTSLPILPGKTDFNIANAIAGGTKRKENRVKQYARRRTRDLPILAPGQRVHIQCPTGKRRWDSQGQVIHVKDDGRKYYVKYDHGYERYVNRIHLKKAYTESENEESDSENVEDDDSATSIPPNSCSNDETNLGEDQETSGSDSDNESEESDYESAADGPALAPPSEPEDSEPVTTPVPELRRSTRAGRGHNRHQSCSACHKLQYSSANDNTPEPEPPKPPSWDKHPQAAHSPSSNQPLPQTSKSTQEPA